MIECEDFDLSPQVYLAIMHSLSIIAIPLNVLAVYCIVYKSTRQMGEYKWYLLCYQLTSTLFDFVYMALTLPVIFFPIPMGYPAAWIAQWLSIGSRISVVLVVPLFASLSATILNLFIYRCHLITPPHHILKLSKHGHIYICVTTVVVFFTGASIGILNIATDQEEAKRWVLEEYTCAKSAISQPRLEIYFPYKLARIAIIGSSLGLVEGFLFVLLIYLSFHFLNKNDHLSQKTREMQRRFLIYLIVQASIPAVNLLLPVLLLLYSFATANGTSQGVGNVALASLGLHGSISALTLIFCNEPYRSFTMKLLTIRWTWKKRQINASRSGEPNFLNSIR